MVIVAAIYFYNWKMITKQLKFPVFASLFAVSLFVQCARVFYISLFLTRFTVFWTKINKAAQCSRSLRHCDRVFRTVSIDSWSQTERAYVQQTIFLEAFTRRSVQMLLAMAARDFSNTPAERKREKRVWFYVQIDKVGEHSSLNKPLSFAFFRLSFCSFRLLSHTQRWPFFFLKSLLCRLFIVDNNLLWCLRFILMVERMQIINQAEKI